MMKDLTKKIAQLTNKRSDDKVVVAIATAWVNMVNYLKGMGMTHDQADSFVYDMFKNDNDKFAEFCKLYI